MAILVIWMGTWQGAISLHLLSLRITVMSEIPNRMWYSFWLTILVTGASLESFHSDSVYSTGPGNIVRVLIVAKYTLSDYALRECGNHQEWVHGHFEPITLSLIEGSLRHMVFPGIRVSSDSIPNNFQKIWVFPFLLCSYPEKWL